MRFCLTKANKQNVETASEGSLGRTVCVEVGGGGEGQGVMQTEDPEPE